MSKFCKKYLNRTDIIKNLLLIGERSDQQRHQCFIEIEYFSKHKINTFTITEVHAPIRKYLHYLGRLLSTYDNCDNYCQNRSFQDIGYKFFNCLHFLATK